MANRAFSPLNHQYEQYPDDIAILKLKDPILGVTPVQLNSDLERIVANRPVTVMGFGGTQNAPNTASNHLKKLNYNITSIAQCDGIYGDQVEIGKNFCTESGACYWDMGAPLIDPSDGRQLGVLTSGFGCGDSSRPDVYSNVAVYYEAIRNCIDYNDCNFDGTPNNGCGFWENPLRWVRERTAFLWSSWWL